MSAKELTLLEAAQRRGFLQLPGTWPEGRPAFHAWERYCAANHMPIVVMCVGERWARAWLDMIFVPGKAISDTGLDELASLRDEHSQVAAVLRKGSSEVVGDMWSTWCCVPPERAVFVGERIVEIATRCQKDHP